MGFMRIDRKKDNRTVHACTHNLADIPNGVTVSTADLIPGVPLLEGTPLGKDVAGIYHAVKTAKVSEAATNTATTYKVAKGHHFKVGDFVMFKTGAKAYAITAIDTSALTHDTLTVGTTLGAAVEPGTAIVQAAAATAVVSAFNYRPVAMCGDSYDVESLSNLAVSAVTIGQFKESITPALSDDIKAALPTIRLI